VYQLAGLGLWRWLFAKKPRAPYEALKSRLLETVITRFDPLFLIYEDDPTLGGPGRWEPVGASTWQLVKRPPVEELRRFFAPGSWILYAGRRVGAEQLRAVPSLPDASTLRALGLMLVLAAHADDDPWLLFV
jgi:hypothetical protein